MTAGPRRKRVALRAEPQPAPELLERIEAIEERGNRVELDDEGGPLCDEDGEVVEDRSACDLEGLSLETYAAFLGQVFPGYVHGYSPSLPPDTPTPKFVRGPVPIVDEAGGVRPGCAEFLQCLQRRARLGMALHRPEDHVRRAKEW